MSVLACPGGAAASAVGRCEGVTLARDYAKVTHGCDISGVFDATHGLFVGALFSGAAGGLW
jgi:hypothetical protein